MLQDFPRRKPVHLVWVAALSIALLAGCGSNGTNDTASTSSDASKEAPSGAAAEEVAAAEKELEPFLEKPTKINQSEPLTKPIPTDKPWVVITCELPACKLISDGALAAAKTAGVPTEVLSYKTTDATTLTTAMNEALKFKPVAVSPVGFTQEVWDGVQPKYKKAGVIITPIAVGDTRPSDVVTEGSASQVDYTRSGELMANFVIAHSGADAKVLLEDIPAFAVLKAYGEGFEKAMEEGCSACTVTRLDLAPAQLANNGVVPAIVSALQKEKDVDYLAATHGGFLVGINPSLKAAGLEDVKIVGGSPDINNLQALIDGTQLAWTGAAEDQYGWVALDIIGRTLNGQDVAPAGGGRSTLVTTKDNVGTPESSGLDAPADYEEQYKKLWGLS
jgi:ribose transport system substrate-binding protein